MRNRDPAFSSEACAVPVSMMDEHKPAIAEKGGGDTAVLSQP